MTETKCCPQCQSEIPAGAPEGLCPKCLLQAGLDTDAKTAAYAAAGSKFTPPAPSELQSIFPQVEILELVGKGGMGAVYKARQPGLDRLVAVKILPPEVSQDPAFVERFTREAKALARLSHPNIVGVHDVGQAGGYCYFVMEFVDGINLRQAMRQGELKPAEALKIVPQICDALQFAHDEGIVHRDIKPENILIDKKGRVKIADFGLAKLLGAAPQDISLTGTQQVMGTLHYMAPEQYLGARDVDHRADIYSLGVTFYEMLTGELPIGRFAPPSKKVQIDVRLDEVVLRSLEKEPEQRFQHASDIKVEMESIARGTAPPLVQPTPPTDEHPLLKGTRFMMTPQPGYARWVGGPMLTLLGLYMFASMVVLGLTFVFEAAQWLSAFFVCGGSVFLGVTFVVLNLVWLARRNTAQAPPPQRKSDWDVPRPRAVTIIAVINVFLAVNFLFVAIGDLFMPGDIPLSVRADDNLLTLYKAWVYFEAVSGYLSAAFWFAASIGLLLWKEWGRRMTVWVAVLLLAIFVLEVPAYVAFILVPIVEEAPLVAGGDPGEQALYVAFVLGFVTVTLVLGIGYLIFELVYFSRPHVVAAFGGQPVKVEQSRPTD